MDYIIQYTVYVLILSVLLGLSSIKLYQKMGYKGWEAFVPFYNYYIIQKEVGEPKWWVIFVYMPIIGPIMMTVFHIFLMKKFGRTTFLEQLLTAILPFIYLGYTAYFQPNKVDRFAVDDPKAKKETFVGSITFAVVFATIVHAFVTQPFAIPTGSMERTLLVGDFLFVNKWSYGYRMPMRPVALPFLQGTIMDTGEKGNPKDDPKSYVDAIKLPYFRIGQFKKPQRYDIVVFNYPQDSVHKSIDRKDPYVKRCVGIPGDVIEFKNSNLFINGKPEVILGDEEQQRAYIIQSRGEIDVNSLFNKFGNITINDIKPSLRFDNDYFLKYKINPQNYNYRMVINNTILNDLKANRDIVSIQQEIEDKNTGKPEYFAVLDDEGYATIDENNKIIYSKKIDSANSIFPINKNWNKHWYGPLKIPKKGDVITLNQDNLPTYRWIISEYEHHHLENKNGKILIDGKITNQYTIQQDYYMMCGDNRDSSLDARYFGFVPEENIIGSPMFTWLSLQGVGMFKDKSVNYQPPFKFRLDRMFKATNTGEKNKTSYWWIAAILLILFFGWEYFVKLFKKKKEED